MGQAKPLSTGCQHSVNTKGGRVKFLQGNPFIAHLNITQVLIQHSHVVAPKFFLPWNFTKELYKNDYKMIIFL